MFADVDQKMAEELAKNVGADKPYADRVFDPVGVKSSKEAKE